MANPVTGPFTETYSTGLGQGSRYMTRDVYRQAKPYDKPLPYKRIDRGIGLQTGWGTGANDGPENPGSYGSRSPPRMEDLPSWFKTSVENQARERLMGKISSEALLWATAAEARRSVNMMANDLDLARRAVTRLPTGLYHGLLRGTLVQEAGRIGVKGVGKEMADNILKVYFGYIPIMSDVQTAAEVLSKDFGSETVEASAKRRDNKMTRTTSLASWVRNREEWWYKVKCGCEARVDNPNLFLANKLGLVNPFATGWELMRWSFVVDYFVNVNQFIGSMTETLGLQLSKPWTRSNMWSFCDYETRDYNLATGALLGAYQTGIWYRETRASTSLPSVKLGVRQLSFGKDLSRLVTSGALLLQALARKR